MILLLCGVVTVAYAGRLAVESAVRWLHQQPEFQVKFSDIELVPAPPSWFRGGPARFLDRVRRDANESESIPVLDDPRTERVLLAFSKFAWVRRVVKIAYPPKKIRVEVEYYVPVATLQINPVDRVALDEAGHVLPIEDVDTERRPLIGLVAKGSVVDPESRPGLVWKTADALVDRKILDGARLAGFLMAPERRADAMVPPHMRIEWIFVDGVASASGSEKEHGLVVTTKMGHGYKWFDSTHPNATDADLWKAFKAKAAQERPVSK